MASSNFISDIRNYMRLRQYSIQTEKTYLHWIKCFIRFHCLKHPSQMGAKEVVAFLDHLANHQYSSAGTQKTALNALAFLYNKYLQQELGDLGFSYAKKSPHIPIVLNTEEVSRILSSLANPRDRLIISILYGSGLRISEYLRLRVQDLDFGRGVITIHDGKGRKDRTTILAGSLKAQVEKQRDIALEIQSRDNLKAIGALYGARTK